MTKLTTDNTTGAISHSIRAESHGPQSALESLPTYNRELALEKVGGNPEIADELLSLLISDLPQLAITLDRCIRCGDVPLARGLAHRIQGAASWCAALALQCAAQQLERAAASPSRELGSLWYAHANLQQEIQKLLEERVVNWRKVDKTESIREALD